MRDFYPKQITAATHPWLLRDDLVFFSPYWDFAAAFAAAYPDGAVYEVQPDGEISLDPDAPAGEGWRARSATITRVVTPMVELPRHLPMKDLADRFGQTSAVTNRMASLLRREKPRQVACERGHTHFGQFNAAGMLLRDKRRYLVQLRAPGTQHGGSWGLPGGALHWEEHPYSGALREAVEEMGPLPELKPRVIVVDDHGGWKYYTVVADVPESFMPVGGDGEGVAYRWCTEAELWALRLHLGLAEAWPRLVDLLARY
ncbi:NUDIX hydrolase [Streptomyces sp. NPDC002838]|uniref:NUDIX hydrolase n=1 Tax=Streptomyces sp. NPDC002838 TaxID=3154436 RepID=UPI003326C49F